jgi:hypothetical protein
MKRYFAAAGALLLSSSTVALAADVKMGSIDTQPAADAKASADLTAAGTGWNKPLSAAKSDFGIASDSKLGTAGLESDLAKMASPETGAKMWTASADPKFQTGWSDSGGKLALATDAKSQTFWDDGGDKLASADSGLKLVAAETGDKVAADTGPKLASADTGTKFQVPSGEARAQLAASGDFDAKLQTASGDPDKLQLALGDKNDSEVGMGGPLETASSDNVLAPQPAAQNYPACDPGPGDDRCIQLYERGVRERLASWDRPTGGLLDEPSQTAMGGPFEPVSAKADATTDTAAAGSSWKPVYTESELAINDAAPKTAAPAESTASDADDVGEHSTFTGVGGPVEAQSGYPPCSQAGPGEDRCIQLYEAGVSGAGN